MAGLAVIYGPCPGSPNHGTTAQNKAGLPVLGEMTMMILHHGWRSSASRRVRLCLEEKDITYEGHVVDMARMEHHSPEYLKINPLGVIPTLIHDDQPLHESGTICEYLDETFPDPPLRPETPYQRAEMRNWIRHIDALIGNLIIFNWRHHLAKTASQWTDAELAEKLKNIPSKERQEAWIRAARKPYTEEERDAARSKLVMLLDKMEEAMKPTGWLVGKAYSIADIAAAPFVKRIDEEIAPDEVSAKKHPRVHDWWTKLQARPAYARANFGPFIDS
jgi:glutathione S-transferase